MSNDRVDLLVRRLADQLAVEPAPVDAIVRLGRRRARSRYARTAIGLVAAVGMVVAVVAVTHDAGRSSIGPTGVVRVENPVPSPWWGDGTLHLAHVTLPAPGLVDLVAVGDSVVYGTEGGDVVLVDPDGRSATIGHKVFEAPLAGGTDEDWVAWVEPRDHRPQLVVYDLDSRHELGRLDLLYRGERWEILDGGDYPFAIEDHRVYYAAQDGDWSWDPGQKEPRREGPASGQMFDAEGGLTVTGGVGRGPDPRLVVVNYPSEGDPSLTYGGAAGWLSPGAHYAAVRSDSGLAVWSIPPDSPVPGLALDLTVPHGLDAPEVELTFADPRTAVVATGGKVIPPASQGASDMGLEFGPRYDTWDLSICDLVTQECTVTRDVTTKAAPILPE